MRPILNGYGLSFRGIHVPARVYTLREAELAALMPEKMAADMSKYLLCPMPGLIKAINVDVGDEVKAGDPLAIVEAMKMKTPMIARISGKVTNIAVKAGDPVEPGQVLLTIS